MDFGNLPRFANFKAEFDRFDASRLLTPDFLIPDL
jgi:hypothetical protein